MLDGCECYGVTGSGYSVCVVSAVVGWVGSAWSMGAGSSVGSGWGVGSGTGSRGMSSSVLGIGEDSGSIGCDTSSVIGFPSMVGVGAGVVDFGSS